MKELHYTFTIVCLLLSHKRDRVRLEPFGTKVEDDGRQEKFKKKKKTNSRTNASRQMKSQIFDEPPLGIVLCR